VTEEEAKGMASRRPERAVLEKKKGGVKGREKEKGEGQKAGRSLECRVSKKNTALVEKGVTAQTEN